MPDPDHQSVADRTVESTGQPVNPGLTATLRAECEALRNDVEQATGLAADFQRQLSGKSNEFAELKRVFEKTAADLLQLRSSIDTLREERHRLANDAMRGVAFEQRLKVALAERDQAQAALKAASVDRQSRDAVVERLTSQVQALQAELLESRNSRARGTRLGEKDVPTLIDEMAASLQRLRILVQSGSTAPERAPRKGSEAVDDVIEISFER